MSVIERFETLAAIPPRLQATLVDVRQEFLWTPERSSEADYVETDGRSIHFVARESDRLQGYAQYDPALNRLRQMLVLPAARGRGVGRRLVEAVRCEALRSGCDELIVHAWTTSSGFYGRAGFVPDGREVSDAAVPWLPMRVQTV